LASLLWLGVSLGGCAIQYYDPETQTDHIWGIGHMQMRVSEDNEGVRAVVRGTDTIGLSAGRLRHESFFSLGWQRNQWLDVIDSDTAIRLEWPSNDFSEVRVGTAPPFEDTANSPNPSSTPKE